MEQSYEMRHFCHGGDPPPRQHDKYYTTSDRDWDGSLDTDGLDISQLDSYINDSNSDTMYFGDLASNAEDIKNAASVNRRQSPSRHQQHPAHHLHQLPPSNIHQRLHPAEILHAPSYLPYVIEPPYGSPSTGPFISINLHNHDYYTDVHKCHLPESPPDSASEPSYSPQHSNISPNQKAGINGLYNSQPISQSLLHLGGYGPQIPRVLPTQHGSHSLASQLQPRLQSSSVTPISVGHNFGGHATQGPSIQVDPAASLPPGSPSSSVMYTQLVPSGCQHVNGDHMAKKRKLSDIHGIHGGQTRSSVDVKQEPDQSSKSRQNNKLCSPASVVTTSSQPSGGQNGATSHANDIHYQMDEDDFSLEEQSNSFLDPAYQCIRFQPFQQNTWGTMCDASLKEISLLTFRVDADKGFNFSHPDDAFVCQKKNHFQVTTHIQVSGTPCYLKAADGLKKIEKFCVHFYGAKTESPSQLIRVEQSQSDRSKRVFHPAQIDVLPDKIAKLTVGRLHFAETTSNNMRKKGKPNPEQRYFYLVVALHAHSIDSNYPIILHCSEKIIVRASNPGQFESDVEYTFQRGCYPESIYHMGRVGINTDRPDEALSVHGNLKISGQILQPSDIRAKENIQEIDTREQLNNVKCLRVVKYGYKESFAKNAGLRGKEIFDTGVIAQEVKKIIPDAVREAGDISLANGDKIRNFLLVNKDRIYMENVGAVKELCKVTGNLESRIGELERMNNKLKRIDSMRSTGSSTRASSVSHVSAVSHRSYKKRRRKKLSREELWSRKVLHISKMAIFCFMALCLAAMSTLYVIEYRSKESRIGFSDSIDGANYTIISSHTTSMPFNFSIKTIRISSAITSATTPPPLTNSSYTKGSYTQQLPRETFVVSIVPQDSSSTPASRRPSILGVPENCQEGQTACETYCCPTSQSANAYDNDSSAFVTRTYTLNGMNSDSTSSEQELETNKVYTTGPYINSYSTVDLRDTELKNMPSKKSSNNILSFLRLYDRPTQRRNLFKPKLVKRILNKRSVFRETMPRITIPELSAEIFSDYCLREDEGDFQRCVNNTSTNITYAIPLSKFMPYVNLTLQFKFASAANIGLFRQCSVAYSDNVTNSCVLSTPVRVSTFIEMENDVVTVSMANLGHWQKSVYKFALPLRYTLQNPCDATSVANWSDFIKMSFIFYRVCDS